MQAAAGFFAYFVVMGVNGFQPDILFGLRDEWEDENVNNLQDSLGQRWVRKDPLCSITIHFCRFLTFVPPFHQRT